MQGDGFETWRLIHARCSTPLGTRSIGYLTRLLKPQLDEQLLEESFTTWEFQLSKYEQDNNTLLPDAVKIAILLNETKGPLQQHLQLQAGNITTYASMVIKYYRATASVTRLQAITSGSNNQGPAPMDIGATWYNKGKGKKGKHKGKGKYNKGKGYGIYGNNYSYNNNKGGKGKYNQQPLRQRNPTWIWRRKRIQQQGKRQRIGQGIICAHKSGSSVHTGFPHLLRHALWIICAHKVSVIWLICTHTHFWQGGGVGGGGLVSTPAQARPLSTVGGGGGGGGEGGMVSTPAQVHPLSAVSTHAEE